MFDTRREPGRRALWLVSGSLTLTTLLLTGAALQDKSPAKKTSPQDQKNGEKRSADDVIDRVSRGLIGSKHDFSQLGGEPRALCTPCHTPHLSALRPPRFDRRKQAAEPLRPFQSTRINLDSGTLLCLSCHDGKIAPDVYSQAHAVSLENQLGVSRLPNRGLRTHPIGIEYPRNNPKFRPAAAVVATRRAKLPAGRVQCTSCHDPHRTNGHEKFLISSNRRSRLCLTCHRI